MRYFKSFMGMIVGSVLSVGAMASTASLLPDDSSLPEAFRGWNTASPFEISYADLDYIYKRSVLAAGGSDRQHAPITGPEAGTRIDRSNFKPTRLEGNRINFDIFQDGNLELIGKIRRDLEGVPDLVPMADWRRDEQLAYWLNLYNLTVIEQIALDYPVTRLGGLYRGGKGKIWTDKLLTVAGVPLSLNDIRFNILIPKWRNPLVMYGLFDGFVGSPNMRKEAYTAKDVYKQLEENAREFINSNRGVRGDGARLRVSTLYELNAPLFPEGDTDLKRHFAQFAEWDLQPRVSNAASVRADVSDYYIADLHGGHKGPTSSANTNLGAFVSKASLDPKTDAWLLMSRVPNQGRYPVHVWDYMARLIKRNGTGRVGQIHIDEVARGKVVGETGSEDNTGQKPEVDAPQS